MKKFKTKDNEIYAYEDNVDKIKLSERIIKLDLIPITEEEAIEIYNLQNQDNQIAQKQELAELQSFLSKSDYIAIHYGILFNIEERKQFLKKESKTFKISNYELLEKRIKCVDRINELKEILNM